MYQPILLDVLRLFGLAIHTSLERILGKYLKATDGIFRNDLRSDWEVSGVGKLLRTNNAAERPFGVAKGTPPAYTSTAILTLDVCELTLIFSILSFNM